MTPHFDPQALAGLPGETLSIIGRVLPASNQTYLCRLGDTETRVIYKPVLGERPLWDFPHGTLAQREFCAWLVSETLGWHIVPPTLLREGPHGLGMVQLWQDIDPEQSPVDVVPLGQLPAGHVHVLDAEGPDGEPVELTHEDTPELRRMAAFDVITNNTDRKGGHILAMPGGHRFGVDHGICFHQDDKLRTVLWGFAGQPLGAEILAGLSGLLEDSSLRTALCAHLSVLEVERTWLRAHRLAATGTFPEMGPGWPSIPWPPF